MAHMLHFGLVVQKGNKMFGIEPANDGAGFEHSIGQIYDLLWKPLIDEARSRRCNCADIELGAPDNKSTEEYLRAGSYFLQARGIPYFPVLVAATPTSAARIILRVSVTQGGVRLSPTS